MPSGQPGEPPQPDGLAATGPGPAGRQSPADPETDRALGFQPVFGTLRRRPASTPGSAGSSWPLIAHPIIAIVLAILVLAAALILAGRT